MLRDATSRLGPGQTLSNFLQSNKELPTEKREKLLSKGIQCQLNTWFTYHNDPNKRNLEQAAVQLIRTRAGQDSHPAPLHVTAKNCDEAPLQPGWLWQV